MPHMPHMPQMPVGIPSLSMLSELTDDELKKKFEELDKDKTGTLCKAEIRAALKDLGRSETEIEEEIGRMHKEELNFEDFRLMAKPPKQCSKIHNIPGVGAFTSALSNSMFGKMTDEELRDAFKKIDVDGSGKLCKKELGEAMKQLGKPERTVQGLLDSIPEGTELDFDGFKELVQPKPLINMPTALPTAMPPVHMPAMPAMPQGLGS